LRISDCGSRRRKACDYKDLLTEAAPDGFSRQIVRKAVLFATGWIWALDLNRHARFPSHEV
jgi:hypothetical protein